MKIASRVMFYTAKKETNIVKAINQDNDQYFKCYGTGNKGFKNAMHQVEPDENVFQVKVGVSHTELLYTY